MYPARAANSIPILLLLLLVAMPGSQVAAGGDRAAQRLEKQRAAFRDAHAQAELGNSAPTEAARKLLRDYPLWPDLQVAYLKSRVRSGAFDDGDEKAIAALLDEYGALRPARELRYYYSLGLAKGGRLAEYLDIYRQFYEGLDIATLDCLGLQAELADGRGDRIVGRAVDLWLVGRSQEDECNPVFDYLSDNGKLDAELYRQRYELAIEAGEFSLARYLSAPLDPSYRAAATTWIAARDNPRQFVGAHTGREDTDIHRRQLVYAIERIAFQEPELAAEQWRLLQSRYSFDEKQTAELARHIALWSARRQSPFALDALRKLPPAAVDTEVRRWSVRTGLQRHDWAAVVDEVAGMPADEQQAEEWQYWHATALKRIGQNDHALSVLHTLATQRSYYGFLAADDLGLEYEYAHNSVAGDAAILARLEADPALIRARELFHVGQDSRGRSEWDAVVGVLNAHEKMQAAVLAHRWGWHSRAIAAAADAGRFDDLDIRYPLAFAEPVAASAMAAQIPQSWVYGVARSESLFMPDVRSSAGAIGVMQLMPETGRITAREIAHPYSGLATLTDPASNIRLGATYLARMYERFGANRVLATAAYNAGPLKVESWLPRSDSVDARIWIENIPYNETRRYVRRVLAAEAIFHWRMTGNTRRLSSELPPVESRLVADPVASNR